MEGERLFVLPTEWALVVRLECIFVASVATLGVNSLLWHISALNILVMVVSLLLLIVTQANLYRLACWRADGQSFLHEPLGGKEDIIS